MRTPIERDRERAAAISAPYPRTCLREAVERGGGGMAVAVVDAGTDRRKARAQHVEQCSAGGGGAAVVGDLEQVPAPTVPRDDLQQIVVAVFLEVAS